MKPQYAFFLMGSDFDTEKDRAVFETSRQISLIYTVNSLEQAVLLASCCQQDGVGAIELCGAFGEEGAAAIIDATGGQIPVGYVTHNPDQDALFDTFFSSY